ncbi:glycerol-3-phosphate 1-O-acyltransferase PlsY [Ketogulonicigenium vulgare]|nr:glycerol-3-phosphate 1-O-acyltransferase PlsY [Ketogulonicigenium vulgare]ADO41743.1 Glycerol-3-phosphate acyltransferase [Ketogulonicigenium vulgare Y25]ALJ80185.1 glycerol-3-phosphate acyltransferase [Ketogulonicigenium vulgare]ANW33047.1 glycerol-3-phosphate acyltransferase [Ketogulonicigenium vulgare]AOZ53674.1 putative glycerol-3-phosphate acyltransferase PlsY [Ketogulonicigenium vulgare]
MPELVSSPTVILLCAVFGYLLGSVPFGILVARVMNLGDLRQIGSGNIGATNVLRTGNKKAAALTLLLDGLKGAVAVLLARAIAGEDAAQIAALAAFIGHCFPVWLGFKGGKGVATFFGVALALSWPVGLLAAATWLIMAFALRYSSAAALTAALLTPVFAWFTGNGHIVMLMIVLVALIFWRHHENISRLIAGTESKIGKK